MNERKDPPEFNGGKYPANGGRTTEGLALAEFIDSAGVGSSDDAPVQGSLRIDDVGPVPPQRLSRRFDVALMEHPFALATGSAIAGFALGVIAASLLGSGRDSKTRRDLPLESRLEIFEIETDAKPRGGI